VVVGNVVKCRCFGKGTGREWIHSASLLRFGKVAASCSFGGRAVFELRRRHGQGVETLSLRLCFGTVVRPGRRREWSGNTLVMPRWRADDAWLCCLTVTVTAASAAVGRRASARLGLSWRGRGDLRDTVFALFLWRLLVACTKSLWGRLAGVVLRCRCQLVASSMWNTRSSAIYDGWCLGTGGRGGRSSEETGRSGFGPIHRARLVASAAHRVRGPGSSLMCTSVRSGWGAW
jgi:hypothetical protein